MVREAEIASVSAVLLGSFAPAMFHPQWFAAHSLLPQEEADNANVQLVGDAVSGFSLEWMTMQVTSEQFIAEALREPYEQLRDFVVGTFDLLNETRVTMLGINKQAHFKIESEDVWHGVGHRLVPPENWPLLRSPGLLTLTEQGLRPDDYSGYIRVTVEPSIRVHPGVYVRVNDHFQWELAEGQTAVREALTILQNDWESSLSRATVLLEGPLGEAG